MGTKKEDNASGSSFPAVVVSQVRTHCYHMANANVVGVNPIIRFVRPLLSTPDTGVQRLPPALLATPPATQPAIDKGISLPSAGPRPCSPAPPIEGRAP